MITLIITEDGSVAYMLLDYTSEVTQLIRYQGYTKETIKIKR